MSTPELSITQEPEVIADLTNVNGDRGLCHQCKSLYVLVDELVDGILLSGLRESDRSASLKF